MNPHILAVFESLLAALLAVARALPRVQGSHIAMMLESTYDLLYSTRWEESRG